MNLNRKDLDVFPVAILFKDCPIGEGGAEQFAVMKSATVKQMPVHEERLMSRPIAAEHDEVAQSAARKLAAGVDCGREGLDSLHEVWRRHVLSRDNLVIHSSWVFSEDVCADCERLVL